MRCPYLEHSVSSLACSLAGLFIVSHASVGHAADSPATFLRGLNLNGPAVTIDGNRWEGKDAKQYVCKDKGFDSQNVELLPPTDADRATMLRSSRWGGNRVELSGIPNGR